MIICVYIVHVIYQGVTYPEVVKNKDFMLYAGVCLVVTGNLFLISGIMINFRIKDYFWDFYDENSFVLWAATFMLSIPIIGRGLIDLARHFNDTFNKFLARNSIVYTPFFYILLDIMPLCFQISSLVFGFIRYKKNRELARQEMEQQRSEIFIS